MRNIRVPGKVWVFWEKDGFFLANHGGLLQNSVCVIFRRSSRFSSQNWVFLGKCSCLLGFFETNWGILFGTKGLFL